MRMRQRTITLQIEDYKKLKRKAELADNVLLQLESSLEDMRNGRVKRVA